MGERKTKLGHNTLQSLSYTLTDQARDDWRSLADVLGYGMSEMQGFIAKATHTSADLPCYLMLKDWARKDGSTVNVLRTQLVNMGRQDAVRQLDSCLQSK